MFKSNTSLVSKVSTLAVIAALTSVSAFAAKAKNAKEEKVTVDASASVLKWEGKKVVGDSKHTGEIKLKGGEFVMSGTELKSGQFTIDMNSITDTDLTDAEYNKKLITHLKSEDFFDVAKYPTSVLKFKSIKSVHGIAGPTFEITADLTIKAKTAEVTFPAVIKTKDGKSTFTANVTIDRTKWEIKYGSGKFFPSLGDKMIADTFTIDAALASK